MGSGHGIAFALALTAVMGPAIAEETADELLACAAELSARATYAETLGHSDAGHIGFLRGRSNAFLRLAEARAPKQMIGCGESGPRIGTAIRKAPRARPVATSG